MSIAIGSHIPSAKSGDAAGNLAKWHSVVESARKTTKSSAPDVIQGIPQAVSDRFFSALAAVQKDVHQAKSMAIALFYIQNAEHNPKATLTSPEVLALGNKIDKYNATNPLVSKYVNYFNTHLNARSKNNKFLSAYSTYLNANRSVNSKFEANLRLLSGAFERIYIAAVTYDPLTPGLGVSSLASDYHYNELLALEPYINQERVNYAEYSYIIKRNINSINAYVAGQAG